MPRLRIAATSLAAALAAAAAPARAEPPVDPDADDQGDFWAAVLAPSGVEVESLIESARTQVMLAHQAADGRTDPRYRGQRLREATAMAARVHALDPRAPGLAYLRGIIADEAGRATTAERELADFVARAPSADWRNDALLRLGRIALVRRDPRAAIGPLRRALAEQRNRGDRARALLQLATALDESGDLDGAIALLAGAIDRTMGPGEAEDNAVWLALVAAYDRDEQLSASLELVERLKGVLGTDYVLRLITALDDQAPAPLATAWYLRAMVYETGDQLVAARAAWVTYLALGDAARYRPRAQAHVDAIDAALAARRTPPATRKPRSPRAHP